VQRHRQRRLAGALARQQVVEVEVEVHAGAHESRDARRVALDDGRLQRVALSDQVFLCENLARYDEQREAKCPDHASQLPRGA
jgi:hypothetical protein